jgi:hypothetical protein
MAPLRQFINNYLKSSYTLYQKLMPSMCIMKIISALATAPFMSEEEVDNSLMAN